MADFDILDSNGNPVNKIVLEIGSDWTPPEGHTIVPHDNSRWVSTPAPMTKISTIEFKIRFTTAERVGIYLAAESDPMVKDFVSMLDDHRLIVVDLESQSTTDDIGYLISKNLLTQERATEILRPII